MCLRQVLAARRLALVFVLSLALFAIFFAPPSFTRPAARPGARQSIARAIGPDGSHPPEADANAHDSFFPLSQVHPGLKGVGKTVLQGDQVTEFQVEILGLLKNVLAPKHDAILVRLSGGGIERTNIVAGMSGSPVYIDGKLLGAVAISFPFAKEPYGLVTPIEDMLAVTPATSASGSEGGEVSAASGREDAGAMIGGRFVRVAGGSADDVRLISGNGLRWWSETREGGSPELGGQLTGESSADSPSDSNGAPAMADLVSSLRLPVSFTGFDPGLMRQYAGAFRRLGLEPMEGGGLTSAEPESPPQVSGQAKSPASVNAVLDGEPGEMVSLLFVSGDFNLAADCTVTFRQGDRLYACGHQVFQLGATDIPFAPARVLATIPALTVSFKVDDAGLPMGSIRQDRFGAIYGVVGRKATTIPVSVRVDSTLGRMEAYHFNVAQAPLLTPLLVQVALASTVGATERALGPSTFHLTGKIRLTGGEAVDLDDVLASASGASSAVGTVVAAPLNLLLSSDFPGLRVEGIDLDLAAQDKDRTAGLDEAWASKSEVHPGDSIELVAVVRSPSGETLTQRIPVHIPENVSSKMLSLVVGSGSAIDALEGRITPLASQPRDVHQMVRALNRTRRNNRLYAALLSPAGSFRIEGEEFPSPPPSLLQTFLADPSSTARVVPAATSVVGDFETGPTPYTIAGTQTLLLRVVRGSE